ncbi:MAG TPA: F0F1 ATP synthase subunit B [Chthoniobacterales bacterium]
MHLTILAQASGGIVEIAKDTAETFGLDLGLFLSQVISFVLVAALLRRFAYKPILNVLHERRERIAEGLRNADAIKQQLAKAEERHQEILAKANVEAQRMIDEARESAGHVAERREQEAIAAAEQILAKAREASVLEHERTMAELKREVGRLVVDTTAKVTGKVLTSDDQRRLQEETSRQLAS